MWMQEGHTLVENESTEFTSPCRLSVMLNVDSIGALYKSLQEDGARILLDAPQEMMPGTFFLKFLDPSGNVVDVLGGE